MPKLDDADDIEPINGYYAGGGRRAADLARSSPSAREAPKTTARARISAQKPGKGKRGRAVPMGPTPERIAKGDISPMTAGGFRRSIPPIERLRDAGKLDHCGRTNEALHEAASKLNRHFIGAQFVGVRGQDLTRVSGGAGENLEDHREYHRKMFAQARTLMGYFEHAPNRGAARVVIAVVCEEMAIGDAGRIHIGSGRAEVIGAQAMDRLRQGLWMLAQYWRLL